MCYKHSLYLKTFTEGCRAECARARTARAKGLCSLPGTTCYKYKDNITLIFHRENFLSDIWRTSCVRFKGSQAAFCQLQTVSVLSLFISLLPVSDSLSAGSQPSEAKPCKASDERALVLTSLLRSATPQEPAGFAMRAATAIVREQQERGCRGGRAQPWPPRSWGGDHSPELKCSSTAKGLRHRARFHTAPFLMAVFHNIFFIFIFDTLFAKELNCYIPFGTGKSEANTM